MHSKSRLPRLITVIAMLASAVAIPAQSASAVPGDVTVNGGGWGHGIGMPQYGAKAHAESGDTAEEIIGFYYTGVSIGQVGSGDVVGHDDPLWINVAAASTLQNFSPVGGDLQLCVAGDCSLVASPGDGYAWKLKSDGAGVCQFYVGNTAVGTPGECEGSISWSDQPDTRVTFPDIERTYARGTILIKPATGGGFHLVVEIGIEEYLYGIGEMPSSWPAEALQAQAIASRTYAVERAYHFANLTSNTARMDVCACHMYSSIFDQKYIGWAKESEKIGSTNYGALWVAAVDGTEGEVATHPYSGGRAIEAYFHSSTGGATENNEDIWTAGSPRPYLRSVPDIGSTSWSQTFSASTFASKLGFTTVSSVTILGQFASGSPTGVQVVGTLAGSPKTTIFAATALRTLLGLLSHHITSIDGFDYESEYGSRNFDGGAASEVGEVTTNGDLWVYTLGSGMVPEFFGSAGVSAWTNQLFGDFTGDGLGDVALFDSQGKWKVGVSDGDSSNFGEWADFATASGWKSQVVGDFNGDGKDDIANFHPSNGTWWVSRSTGSGFTTSLWADFATASGWGPQVVGDFNGDGKDDIANFHPSNGTWWVSKSSGSGFTTSLWADFYTASGWGSQIVGDFNGDGKDDIANFHPSNGSWWRSQSNGTKFTTSLKAALGSGTWVGAVVGDLNGDDKDDLAIRSGKAGPWSVTTS